MSAINVFFVGSVPNSHRWVKEELVKDVFGFLLTGTWMEHTRLFSCYFINSLVIYSSCKFFGSRCFLAINVCFQLFIYFFSETRTCTAGVTRLSGKFYDNTFQRYHQHKRKATLNTRWMIWVCVCASLRVWWSAIDLYSFVLFCQRNLRIFIRSTPQAIKMVSTLKKFTSFWIS